MSALDDFDPDEERVREMEMREEYEPIDDSKAADSLGQLGGGANASPVESKQGASKEQPSISKILSKAYYNGLDKKGWSLAEEKEAVAQIETLIQSAKTEAKINTLKDLAKRLGQSPSAYEEWEGEIDNIIKELEAGTADGDTE